MTYLAKALRFDADAMVAYILALPKTGFKSNPNTGKVWAPIGVVSHNTGVPSVALWGTYRQAQKDAWGDNLNSYYKNMGWHSGPHFAATPDFSLVLCDPLADGIHDTCRNATHFGVEMVGDFRVGGDPITTLAAQQSINNAINIIAALSVRFGFDPHALDFHRRCTHDNHACPGDLISDDFMIAHVALRMDAIKALVVHSNLAAPNPLPDSNLHPEATPMPPTILLPDWPPVGDNFFKLGARAFNKWLSFGVSNQFALGMLAQGEAECSLNVKAVGDKGTAFGLDQWHADRVAAILKGCGIDVRTSPKIEDHVAAAWWELQNVEKNACAKIKDGATAKDAGMAATIFYERAGAPLAAERRGAMAERWADLFTKSPELLKDNPAQ